MSQGKLRGANEIMHQVHAKTGVNYVLHFLSSAAVAFWDSLDNTQ